MAKTEPIVCEVTRGTMVESVHRVHAMIVDSSGPLHTWGDPDLLFYPRSSIKSIQAIPLIESGAADAFDVSAVETALACASHSSEPAHTEAVASWLARIGLGEPDLGCGPHLPYNDAATHDLIHAGETPSRLHNNCSGKHAGFLTTAKHLGEPLDAYLETDHPVQKRLYDLLTDFGGQNLEGTGRGHDGCGIPVYGMTLRALANTAQRMAAPSGVSDQRGTAIQRILADTVKNAFYVAGTGRFDTDAMNALGGRVATKGGAEGVHIAMIPEKGIGIALKTEDGNRRGGDVAMGWMLDQLGMIDDAARRALQTHLAPEIGNTRGTNAGTVRVAQP